MAKKKWDFLRDTYKRLPPDAGHNDAIEAILNAEAPDHLCDPLRVEGLGRTKIRDLESEKLKKLYVDKRDLLDEATALCKALGLEIEALTREFISRMEEDGLQSMEFTDGLSLGASVEPYPVVKDQAALLGWVYEEGIESMLTLNWQTMATMVKERLEGKVDRPLPPGIDVFLKDKLTCRGRAKSAVSTATAGE